MLKPSTARKSSGILSDCQVSVSTAISMSSDSWKITSSSSVLFKADLVLVRKIPGNIGGGSMVLSADGDLVCEGSGSLQRGARTDVGRGD